jgi:hypothetical protein
MKSETRRLSREELGRMFPRASKTFFQANVDPVLLPPAPPVNGKVEVQVKPPRAMNGTERSFADILEARWRKGEIIAWVYEGLRLKWGDSMHYKPDFVVLAEDKPITLIEVKGAHIWPRDLVRFKGCAAEWKQWFHFQIWQRVKGVWTQLR